MHLSMHMRYKTQLATTLSGVSSGLPAHLRIFDQVASEPSLRRRTQKPSACIFIVFMCGFFAVSDVIHPNPFTVHRQLSHGFVEKISNNGMLFVSLVVLFSSGQYRLEFNL